MTKPVLLSRVAREELLLAAKRYGLERGDLRAQFLRAIDDALERVAKYAPHLAMSSSEYGEFSIKRVRVRRFPYDVYFFELPKVLRVIAVAHQQRAPKYWQARR